MASLRQNTIYLYLLTASNYLFSLATIPYLTRILGPVVYGDLGFSMAVGVYFNLVLDLGFILSGTKRVASNKDNIVELSRILTSVLVIKIVLAILLTVLVLVASIYLKELKINYLLVMLFLYVSFFTSLLPDYMYRGLEDMKIITYRGVTTRGLFTILVFCFLKNPEQVYLVPIFYIIGNIIVCVWAYSDLKKRYKINICRVNLNHIRYIMVETIPYFISRIASSIYNVTNTIILGLFYPGNAVVGYYSSAERFKSIASQGCSPISDSFYPYMIRTKDFSKLIKITILIEIPILIICLTIFIWAKPVCTIIFGQQYEEAYRLLRLIIPIIAITLPSYMFGFPALTPLGKSKWANFSVEIAMINQFIGLGIMIYLHKISAFNLCIVTLISELLVFLIRIGCFIKFYNSYNIKVTGH